MVENVAAVGDCGGRNTILQTGPCSPVRSCVVWTKHTLSLDSSHLLRFPTLLRKSCL